MSAWNVRYEVIGYVTVTVEADTEQEAWESDPPVDDLNISHIAACEVLAVEDIPL